MQAYAVPMNPRQKKHGGERVSSMFGGATTPTAQPVRPKKKSTAQPRPQILVEPRGLGPIANPNQNDVLSGRGGRINAHSGNVQYRQMVLARRDHYLDEKTKKLEKAHIAAQIVYMIRSMNPPGRFLKEDPDGSWYDIGDQKAIKKVGQAMREDAPTNRGESKGDSGTSPEVVSSGAPRVARTASSSKKKSPSQQQQQQPQVIPSHMMPVSTAADGGGYNLQNNPAISAAAAVAVNEFVDDDCFPVPLFGRSYFPPPGTAAHHDSSLLSGTSAPSAMSGVSEISGLTDPISALSGSQFYDGKQDYGRIREATAPRSHNTAASHRMQRLGERVAIDDGIVLPTGREASASSIPEDQASVDMMSLISLGNLSGVLREADRHTVASATSKQQYGADDLSTMSGKMSGLSLADCSTLYDI